MKKLFILLAFVPALMVAQPGTPDANGVITAGPPWVTGISTGGGEMMLQLAYLYNLIGGPYDSDLVISASYAGLLGTKITNTYSGAATVAGAVHQMINDQGYWGLTGMTNSGSTIGGGAFANTMHFYNQGYGNSLFSVDGNKDFVWYSDPTDAHDFSSLSNEIMRLKADGELDIDAITYTDTYWDDLRIPLSNVPARPNQTEPDLEDRGDGLYSWGFDSDADSTDVLLFTTQTPHARKDSSSIEAHIHWVPDGTNTGAVRWRLIYSMANVGKDWTPLDTLWALDAAGGTALRHQIIDFGPLVGSDSMRISAIIKGSIARIGEDALDTYTGTAYGEEIDFHIEIDTPGSREEYVK